MFTSPTLDFPANSCSPEWSKYGTCCELSSLVAYALSDVRTVKHNLAVLTDTLFQLPPLFERLRRSILRRSGQKDAKSKVNKLFSSPEALVFAKNVASLQATGRWKKDSEQCWNLMTKIRTSSVCSVCSGRSQLFFEGARMLIPEKTCSLIVENCYSFFAETLRLTKTAFSLITEVGSILDAAGPVGFSSGLLVEQRASFERVLAQSAFYFARKQGLPPQWMHPRFCSEMLTIAEDTLVDTMSMLVYNIFNTLKTVTSSLQRTSRVSLSTRSRSSQVSTIYDIFKVPRNIIGRILTGDSKLLQRVKIRQEKTDKKQTTKTTTSRQAPTPRMHPQQTQNTRLPRIHPRTVTPRMSEPIYFDPSRSGVLSSNLNIVSDPFNIQERLHRPAEFSFKFP